MTASGLVLVGVMILISLIPEMQAILWLLIVVIPGVIILALVGIVLGLIGIILAIRRQQAVVLPVIGIVLSLAVLVVGGGFINGSF